MERTESVEGLFPVVLRVPTVVAGLGGGARMKALSRVARESVLLSARRAGVFLGEFPKGAKGRPLPWRGIHWSLTHKPTYVAGVVSSSAVGIDIERVKPVSPPLFKRICSQREAALFSETCRNQIFFRCFTAKEAVLKRWGVGLSGLDDVSVISVIDAGHLLLSHGNTTARVSQFEMDGHLVSISGSAEPVEWVLPESEQQTGNW